MKIEEYARFISSAFRRFHLLLRFRFSPPSLNDKDTLMTEEEMVREQNLLNRISMLEKQLTAALASPQVSPKPKLAVKKQQKPFDFSKTGARKVALKISYLGQNYYGFTTSSNYYGFTTSSLAPENVTDQKHELPTIEGEIFKAMMTCKLIPSPDECQWSRAGRTDKGVSGFGQVVSLWIKTKLPMEHASVLDWDSVKALKTERVIHEDDFEDDQELSFSNDANLDGNGDIIVQDTQEEQEYPYVDMINRLLPKEIRILAWTPVDTNFDARFSCKWRKYNYVFSNRNLNLERMQHAASLFKGTHDCRYICKIDTSKLQAPNFFTRTIYESRIEKVDEHSSIFVVRGRAFLWHQVRNMMALLFLVGQELESPEIIPTLLDPSKHPEKAGKPNYEMAPDHPLVLVECGYNGLNWKLENDATFRSRQLFQEQWQDVNLNALQLSILQKEFDKLGADKVSPPPHAKQTPRHLPLLKRGRADSVETVKEKLALKKQKKKVKTIL